MNKKPPKYTEYFLDIICTPEDRTSMLGDLEEEYNYRLKTKGEMWANFWYRFHLIKSLPAFFKNYLIWSIRMYKNYLKVALRNIFRHKGYSLINISGLAIGIACSILILLWVQDELSYDRFNENADSIYRVTQEAHFTDGTIFPVAVTPYPIGPAMKDNFPEIINSMRMIIRDRTLVEHEDRRFFELQFCFIDPSVFDIFTFPFLSGEPSSALTTPNAVVITETAARKYFGEENPLGKTLTVDRRVEFTVTGVIKDIPHNSHFQFDFAAPYETLINEFGWQNTWVEHSYYTYIQLQKGTDIEMLNAKVKNFLNEQNNRANTDILLQALTDIHLRSDFEIDLGGQSEFLSVYVYIFSVIAFFILFIACVNFMNLTTARSANRAKEVGMRKVAGAHRIDLIKQFLGESLLLSLSALVIAVITVCVLIPWFNNLTGKELTPSSIIDLPVILGLVGMVLLTGVFAGMYPAMIISSFKPASVIKGAKSQGAKNSRFRQSLVVIQFSLSIILIVGTFVVYNQLEYIQNRDLGLTKDHIVYFGKNGALRQQFESFRNDLKKYPDIVEVISSSDIPTYSLHQTTAVNWDGQNPDDQVLWTQFSCSHEYLKAFNMEIIEGRDFSRDLETDAFTAYIINNKGAESMGIESPVGKRFSLYGRQGTVIGVVKDFHFKSLHETIEPLVLRIQPGRDAYVFVKLRSDNISETVELITNTHKKYIPDIPFEYQFLDETFNELYNSEQRMGQILNSFALLAIFISCLGLFGLASFMAEQRAKEIGIRKTLGATVPGIVILLSREFLKWVLISNLFAWPAAWFAMNNWLENFVYHPDINLIVFLTAGVLTLVIALLTVSYQSIKVANANPVNSLRLE